jgi:uncharacterized protein (TIGR00269 family)
MQCECGQPAVYYRRYEGRDWCRNCFLGSIEKKFRRTVSKNKLIQKGDRIAVAVSGGKDSLTLLHLMSKIKGMELVAFSIDEGIEGYRPGGIECARRLCKQFGIEHHVYSYRKELGFDLDSLGDILGKDMKHCTYCGVFRRYLLNKKARELGATKLAVGHNMDDEAQSIMMNFVRGDISRFARLGTPSSGSKFVPRIKPLRDIPEKEIAAYAMLRGIEFSDDECPHSFDNVRRDMQGMLNDFELKYPGTKQQIVNFYDRIKGFVPLPEGKVHECQECGEPSSGSICKACELLGKISRLDPSS